MSSEQKSHEQLMSNKQKSMEGVESATTSIPRLQLAHFVLGHGGFLTGT